MFQWIKYAPYNRKYIDQQQTKENIMKLEHKELKRDIDPFPPIGCYLLDLYCQWENPEHKYNEFPHQFTAEKGSTCRKEARKKGWKFSDGFATCPKCAKILLENKSLK
jgi:hypothetical protein